MDSIFHRTSVRKYLDKKIDNKQVEMILRAAMAAPSAKNQQPWEFYVVDKKDKLKELSQTSPYAGCVANAPIAFVACYKKNCDIPKYAHIDMSASVENMLLEIDQLGLGGVWIGIAPIRKRMDAVSKVLEMPNKLEAFAIIPCGYPQEEKTQISRFNEKRVHYISN